MEGAEPRRPDRIRTPEKPLAGRTARPAFPAGGKPRFFTGCTPIFRCSASSAFPEGDNLRKLFAGHAVRPANNFLRACEARPVCSSTQKILNKDFFDKLKALPEVNLPAGLLSYSVSAAVSTAFPPPLFASSREISQITTNPAASMSGQESQPHPDGIPGKISATDASMNPRIMR